LRNFCSCPRFWERRPVSGTTFGFATDPCLARGVNDSMSTDLEAAWQDFVRLATEEQRRVAEHGGEFPHYATDGRWAWFPIDATSGWVDESFYDHGNWTAGFSVGQGWLLRVGDDDAGDLPDLAAPLARIGTRATDNTTHDLGFLFYPSFALGSTLGGLPADAAAPGLTAARVLASRFNDRGEFIQAFGAPSDPRSAGTSTIDTLMNLPLLFWAAGVDEDADRFLQVARRHAHTSAANFFREDGSTFHLIRFDPATGELLHRGTFQGASSASCWSRGQAWAVTGFAWAYGVLGDDSLCEAADRAWDYFAPRVPEDGVVPWDFGDDTASATPDASASAVTALGALLLAHHHPDAERRSMYDETARSLLARLATSAVRHDDSSEGVLLRSCYSKPHGLGVDGATPYGDFYYGLALALATGRVDLSGMCATPAGGPAQDKEAR
jgi:unsaturated chondroitin disaccharide hydrolase